MFTLKTSERGHLKLVPHSIPPPKLGFNPKQTKEKYPKNLKLIFNPNGHVDPQISVINEQLGYGSVKDEAVRAHDVITNPLMN